MKKKPDLSSFLDGASETSKNPSAEKVVRKKPGPVPGEPKRQKLVELPANTFEALKDRAYSEYKKTGLRVTETEIIINALNAYLDVK
ncbi:site-specific recombinase XerC [Undibacterium sp. GrIS 1.8]|uniref:hypothetical protein n=1 Tax=Undibacterium sp. GrIS 1.8 TaxID=3143934 RepID=UPI0033955C87